MNSESEKNHIFHTDCFPSIIYGIGTLFVLSSIVEWVAFNGIRNLASKDFLASLLISACFAVVIVYGGYRLERSALPCERYSRIVKWMLGCSLVFFTLTAPILALWIPNVLPVQVWWTRFVVSVGLTGGLLIGGVEAHAIHRERIAERAEVRAADAETHHQHLDYLNSLLRHEVLNTANVITGYASLLLEDDDLDDTTRDQLETIHRQGRDMTNVIRDVQVLIQTTRGTAEPAVENLSEILADELDDLSRTAESVEIEASIPSDVYVVADDLLPRVFSNLLSNAVEHNDDAPRVAVTVEESADAVTVRIADDGPGIPADERVTLFERGDNTGDTHGLGLYLVRMLVERYGGTVELTETGPDGSTFAVGLPAAK